jgi:hypothetical protein
MTAPRGWRICRGCRNSPELRAKKAEHIVPLPLSYEALLRQAPALQLQLLSLVDVSFNLCHRLSTPRSASYVCGQLVHNSAFSIAYSVPSHTRATGLCLLDLFVSLTSASSCRHVLCPLHGSTHYLACRFLQVLQQPTRTATCKISSTYCCTVNN